MPRFLYKNYTRRYAQEREDLFNRCLLISPGTEFTSNSNIAVLQDQLYAPWKDGGSYSHLFDDATCLIGEINIEEELRGLKHRVPLVESISGCGWGVGESVIELEISDGWSDLSNETFYPDNAYTGWEYFPILVDSLRERVASCLLEEMETCDHLSLHPERYYPSVDKLVGRWKSRPVTDPLLGETGEFLLTESEFLAEDRLLELGVSGHECDCIETFDVEVVEGLRCGGNLLLLESPDVAGWLVSGEVNVLEGALQCREEEMSQLSEVTEDKLRNDIKNLNPVTVDELASGVGVQLEISFTEGETDTYSPQIEDPLGILESPLVPDRSGPSLLSQLATDHPILPLTPLLAPRSFLSPATVEKFERTLRRTNQVPEQLGGMLLVEPEITKQLYYPMVEDLIVRLQMIIDEDVSSLDMELRWDPLTQYYAIIQCTQDILVKQTKLEVKLNSSELNGTEASRPPASMEDLTKYDSLLPALELESLDSVDSSGCLQVTFSAASMDWRNALNDGISAKPKVHMSDQNTELETRARIPQIKNVNHTGIPRLLENPATKTSSVLNQFDDIDSFLLLRQKRHSSDTPPPRINSSPKRVCMPTSPKHSKLVVEQIPLNALYREVLNILTSYGQPLLKQVQEYGHLHDSSFTALLKNPHTLQFLLREHKHQWLEQDMPMDSAVWYKLRTICQLFCLVSSGAALLATSLNAAIDVLFEIVNKYKVLVQDSLVTIGNSLVGMREKVQNSFHPKIIQTIYIVLQNEMKLTKFSNVGIIVFDIECTFNLAGEMIGILESQVTKLNINLIKAPSNETYNYYHEVLLKAFDTSHCLLCESSTLSYEKFPWEKVPLMILYNLNENSSSLSLIKERAHENCEIHLLRASMETDILQTNNITHRNNSSDNTQNSSFIICSTSVSDGHGLLELIESKCNIFVIERDYPSLGLASHSPDIIVNESTCILLVNLETLISDVNIEEIFNKLHNIRIAYTACYILAYTRSSEEYMKGDTPNMLARLNNGISKLEDKHCTYRLKGSTDTDGIASVISSIVNQHTTAKCEIEEVEIEASEQEKWLLSLKCINSCTAITLLSKYSLRELLLQEPNQLKGEYPDMPQQSLDFFHQICKQNYGEWSSLESDKKVHANGKKSDKLIESVDINRIKTNDSTNNAPALLMDKQIKWNDTTLSDNDVNTSKRNCNINIIDKTVELETGNAWMNTYTHSNNLPSQVYENDSHLYTSESCPSILPFRERPQWLHADKVRPKLVTEGILAFQQQEGFPGTTNTHYDQFTLRDGEETNSIASGHPILPFHSDSYWSGHTNNALDTNENCQSLQEERDSRRFRRLSCKQVPGVTQTKLIFK